MKVLDGIQMSAQQIKSMADGSAPTDAVTLQQLQAYVNGLDWKASGRAASTANITVASPGATIDGVTLASGDRVLLKNQTTGSENGIWTWNGAAAALTRPADASQGTLTAGAAIFITEGTTNHDTSWTLQTDDPITVGTTSLTWAQFGGGAGVTYTAGNGITFVSGTIITAVGTTGIIVTAGGIGVDANVVPMKASTTIGNGSLTTIAFTHNLNSLTPAVVIRDTGTNEIVYMKVTVTSATVITMVFPAAPASGQYNVTVYA